MNDRFTRGMAKAAALTRAGQLQEATDLIQSLLGQGYPAAATAVETPPTPKKRQKPAPSPRTGLAETLRKIAEGGMPAHGPLSDAVAVPQGASFQSLTYRGPHGTREYRLYIPARRPDASMPLIVMLHGCTQTPEDFATGTGMNALAEEMGCLIVYPAQPSGANAQKCWNWFWPEDQARDRGEPALIAELTREVLRNHPADAARTYIAGLSAGAAAAIITAAAYPEIFSAVGVHSGLPAGSAQDVPSAFSAMRRGTSSRPHDKIVPTIVFHGQADTTVHPTNGTAVMEQALHAMADLEKVTESGTSAAGRKYRRTAHMLADGRSSAEHWEIEGAGHAWAGGHPAGSYTDPAGPDASRVMVTFFLQHVQRQR